MGRRPHRSRRAQDQCANQVAKQRRIRLFMGLCTDGTHEQAVAVQPEAPIGKPICGGLGRYNALGCPKLSFGSTAYLPAPVTQSRISPPIMLMFL